MSDHAPVNLRIDSGGGRLVVCGARPHLSWQLPTGWPEQDGYVLEARINGVDQAPVQAASPRHLFIPWPWQALASRDKVSWRVRSRQSDDTSPWSAQHEFEVGLLAPDWTAAWISPPEPEADSTEANRPAYTLEGSFVLDRPCTRARLYATALGVYEVYLNGRRVGDTELAPGSTSYAETLYGQAEDITDDVRWGRNEIEIVLSDGWYRGKSGAWRKPARWGTRTAARLEVHIEHPDGTWTTAGTGPRWSSRPSAIVRADLMDGQTTDLGTVRRDPAPVVVDAVEAPPVEWSPAPPVRRIERLEPTGVTRTSPGSCVVDFGQNASGWIALTDLGPAGTRTVIDHGEHVDASGDLTTSHLDSARPGEPPVPFVQRDVVVSDGAATGCFEPRHTIHGFRYAKVQRDDGAEPAPSAISMQVVHTDLRSTGTFACSDPDLTRLHDVARWSFRGNAVDVPTDCPTRERLGWTGDYQIFVSTAVRLFDVDGFSRKWLRSVRDDQLPDGRIVNSSPDPNHLKKHPDAMVDHITGSAGWGDAIVHVPWVLYETYGDDVALAENWDAMVHWVEFALGAARSKRHPSRVERSANARPHEAYLWDGTFHWGEWSEPKQRAADGSLIDPVGSDPVAWFMTDKGEVGTAYLYRSVSTLARIADVLGKEDDARRYRGLAERIRDAWQTEFLDGEGRTTAGTQAGYVRALAFDLVPPRLRDAAAAHLVTLIREAGDHLTTGFLSTADLLPVLADTGHADVAHAVLTRRTEPSWLAMLDRGATTIWEDWEGIDADGNATASLNHYSKGAVVRFLHTHTLGLRQTPGSVAWSSFVVAPVPGPGITWASGSFESPQGTIAVNWALDDGTFRIDVDVPPGSTATVVLPDGTAIPAGPGPVHAECPVPSPRALPVP
ncbi:family 78 glycoside hydrolase catalytic domain [Streptomyces flaveus]|uniref:alpha-L-rhamnosidase n=1 Tax=Streptomyces flaveus TaxID=66370 RepID=A0A917QMP4_9ACTN|nr:family 78 glycoside hydrolase catalytic domain [Streptomyces flaveus]GGK59599.1 alpha-L-rhamnosidase [Streptomyces flaveus]